MTNIDCNGNGKFVTEGWFHTNQYGNKIFVDSVNNDDEGVAINVFWSVITSRRLHYVLQPTQNPLSGNFHHTPHHHYHYHHHSPASTGQETLNLTMPMTLFLCLANFG